MTGGLAVTGRELEIVLGILHAFLPQGTQVDAFGSRVSGTFKKWSDLDLAIRGAQALPLSTLASLAEAFEESELPWKVDLVDRHTISDEFARIIDQSRVQLI